MYTIPPDLYISKVLLVLQSCCVENVLSQAVFVNVVMVKRFSVSCGNCVPDIPHPILDSPFDSVVYPAAVTRNNLLLLRTPSAGVSRISPGSVRSAC